MAHLCEAALVTCEDFRLHQRKDGRNHIAEYSKSLKADCDLITRAGGIQDLVRPKAEAYKDSLLRDIEVSVKLHQAKTIYLVNHEDCGAYAGMDFPNREEELARHYEDLKNARDIIQEEFGVKDIRLVFAELKPSTTDEFIFKQLS